MEFNILILTIILALSFDFINGFHDAANSISTVVTTRVLSPLQAVAWAAFFNFAAYWAFGFTIADTIAKTAQTSKLNMATILSGVIAAITWNLITWKRGIPSSSSHTLIGGFAGAAIATAGIDVVNWYKPGVNGTPPSGVLIVILFIILAPLVGMAVSYILSIWMLHSAKGGIIPKLITLLIGGLVTWYISMQWTPLSAIKHGRFPNNQFLNSITYESNVRWILVGIVIYSLCVIFFFLNNFSKDVSQYIFRKMQLVSSAAFSLGHGGNDAQKVMGIIAAAILVYANVTKEKISNLPSWLQVVLPQAEKPSLNGSIAIPAITAEIPSWLPFACHFVIGLGTMAGGWKIIKTMGTKITKVTPTEGVIAESAGALTLFMTEYLKVPVSTTHTITGSIIGTGLSRRLSSIRWIVTRKLMIAWIITIPISGLIASVVYYFLHFVLKIK